MKFILCVELIGLYRHFLDQNSAIANKSISGIPLNLKTLAIGNGLTVIFVLFLQTCGAPHHYLIRIRWSSIRHMKNMQRITHTASWDPPVS